MLRRKHEEGALNDATRRTPDDGKMRVPLGMLFLNTAAAPGTIRPFGRGVPPQSKEVPESPTAEDDAKDALLADPVPGLNHWMMPANLLVLARGLVLFAFLSG